MASTQDKEYSSSIYAEVVNSTKGKPKINIDGFLYIKDKNRDALHYWFVNIKDKSKCDALQGPQKFVVEISKKFHKSTKN